MVPGATKGRKIFFSVMQLNFGKRKINEKGDTEVSPLE
jgi:hypothetical protein